MKYSGPCGLMCWHLHQSRVNRIAVALRGVDVEVKIVDLCAIVQLSQRYHNDCSSAVQAEYLFPIDSNAAISAFESETNGVVTKGQVKEKQQAKQEFNNAVAHGHSAQLLEQQREDVFTMSVGNLAAYSSTTIRISYVVSLKVDGDAVKFFLPSFIAPRYQPYSETNPLPSSQQGPKYVAEGLRVHVVAAMASNILSVTSETPGIGIIACSTEPRIQTITLVPGVTQLNKDLVLKIRTTTPHEPRVIVERSPEGTFAAVASIVPKIELDDCPREFVFVVDRSGSMSGSNIEQARKAMQLFVRSLPEDCYIDIVGFGSRWTSLFNSRSAKYSNSSLSKASNHISSMRADYGGTELLNPLQNILQRKPIAGYDRQVFVLTDGAVSNTEQVIALVNKHVKSTQTRVFSLGMGHGASHALVDGIARVGGGTAEYCIGEALESKVITQLKIAVQPRLENVTVTWAGMTSQPLPPPPSYNASRPEELTAVHHNIICDGCEMAPLVGKRYKQMGLDYDLCEHDFQQLPSAARVSFEVIPCPGDHPMTYSDHIRNMSQQFQFQQQQQPQPPQPPQPPQTNSFNSLLGAFAPSSVGSLLGFIKKTPAPTNPSQCVGFAPAPFTAPSILTGERHLNFCMVEQGRGMPTSVRICARTPLGDLDVTLPVQEKDIVEGTLVHTMAARGLIKDLTDGTSWLHKASKVSPSESVVKSEIVKLGTKYGLVSKHTSYLAIEPRNIYMAPVPSPNLWGTGYPQQQQQQQQQLQRRRQRQHANACTPASGRSMLNCKKKSSMPMSRNGVRGGGFGGSKGENSFARTKSSTPSPSPCMSGPPPPSRMCAQPPVMKPQSTSFWCNQDDDDDDESDESDDDDDCDSVFAAQEQHQLQVLQGQQQMQQQEQQQQRRGRRGRPQQQKPGDLMQTLISNQDFSGFFSPSAVANITNVSVKSMADAACVSGLTVGLGADIALKVIATQVAISFFQSNLAELYTEWQLVVTKAEKWMKKITSTSTSSNNPFSSTEGAQLLLLAH